MLEIDVLRTADVYAWLGCQKVSARQLGCNQSTVSRRVREATRLAKVRTAWGVVDFLQPERQVHQCWRFSRGTDLRVHAYRWINPQLQRHLPSSWSLNPAEISETRATAVNLLRDRVIDALLAPWPVVQGLDPAQFVLEPLYTTPLQLLVTADHPLSGETGLSDREIARASRLGVLDFVPGTAVACSSHLDAQMFGALTLAPVAEPGCAQAPAGSRFWGTPLTPLVRPDLVALDYPTPLCYGEFLACRHEWRDHAEMDRLLRATRQALAGLPLAAGQRQWLQVA